MNKEPELEDFKRQWNACLDAAEPLLEPTEEVLDGLFYEAVRRRKMRVVRRRRVWSIAASVALVVGVGVQVWDGKLSRLPQPIEVAQAPGSIGVSPVQGGRASSPDLAGKMPAIRGQAVSLPSQPSSQIAAETGQAPSLQEDFPSEGDPDIPQSFLGSPCLHSPAEPIYCAEAFPEEDPGPSHASECNFDCSLLAELNINPLKIFAI